MSIPTNHNHLTDLARMLFEADHFSTLVGIEIVSVGDHQACCRLQVQPHHRNAMGVAMGGCQYTLADFAAAVAANSEYIEEGAIHFVTLNSTIHYLAPARAEVLVADCLALKHGRTTALYQTNIHAEGDSRLLAVVQTTMSRVQ